MSNEVSKGLILLVDDDPGILSLERRELLRAGYSVKAATSARAALDLVAEGVPDLLVIDYQLEGVLTGLDLFREIRGAGGRGTNLPAILVTGFSDERRVIEALRAGIRDVVPKVTDYLDYLPEAVERVLLQVRAEKRLAEAEAAARAKDRFIAILSHELRTPLSPVLMSLGALEQEADLSPRIMAQIRMMRRNVELEVRLIDDLLDLSRVANGKLRLELRQVGVHEVLSHAMDVCQADAQAKGLTVELEAGAANDMVEADGGRLEQVFWNLLRNAIKFTPEGKRVVVRTSTIEGGKIRVEVIDEGIGIAPEALPRVFDAFEQTDQGRRYGGLGLGLAICKAVVDLHGGRICAESPGHGRGSTFAVELETLPVGHEVAREHNGINNGKGSGAARKKSSRVLLVEDHLDTGRTLSRLLEASGYEIRWAKSATAALEAAGEEAFDLVVSDVGLPDATGYDLMRQLRERYGLVGIAMTGYGMDEDIRRGREAGFVEHIVKPVSVARLEEAIRKFAAV
jgi:signal transduction histidine kinase